MAAATLERARYSLSALLADYVKLQQSKGRISAREASVEALRATAE